MLVAVSIALLAALTSASHCRWKNSLMWDTARSGASDWPPLVTTDKLYSVHIGQGVSCAARADGELSWFIEDSAFVGGCAAAGNTVLCPKTDALAQISVAGSVVRTQAVQGTPSQFGAPLVLSGIVYFGTTAGKVYALRTDTLQEVWSVDLGASIVASVVPYGLDILVGTVNGGVFLLRRNDGSTVSTFTASVGSDQGVHSSIEVNENVAYVSLNAPSNNFVAIDLSTMTQKWVATPSNGFSAMASPVVDVTNGAVYIGTVNGALVAYGLDDGSVKWRHELTHDIRVHGPLSVIADNLVAFTSSSGYFIGYDFHVESRAFSIRMMKGTLGSTPAVVGSSAYFAGSNIMYEMSALCELRD